MLRNLVLSGEKFANNDKFNTLISGSVDGCKKINVC